MCGMIWQSLRFRLRFGQGQLKEFCTVANDSWSVYIIRCDDGTLYTGVSTDVARRFAEHLAGKRGARFFNGRRPLEVVFTETGHTRSAACRREAEIKRLSRAEKLAMIEAAAS